MKTQDLTRDKHMSATTHLMTAEELIRLDDGLRHELVRGELLTMSPSGEEHGAVTMRLSVLLGHYVEANQLGTVYAAETGFKLESDPDTVLAPDIAFIRRERVGTLSKSYRPGAPDLVIEVVSPNDRQSEIKEKTSRWLSLGALIVWVVDPRSRTVRVCLASGDETLLSEDDELSAEHTVPGFQILVASIFPL